MAKNDTKSSLKKKTSVKTKSSSKAVSSKINEQDKKIIYEHLKSGKEEVNVNHINKGKLDNHKFYFAYNFRVTVLLLSFVIFMVGALYLVYFSFDKRVADTVTISENGSPDYKVYLKENTFYEDEFQKKGMSYVTSLIDYIDIDYNLVYSASRYFNNDYDYKIVGILTINEAGSGKQLLQKIYNIVPYKSDTSTKKYFSIKENVKIDYDKYNAIAEDFKREYNISTDSNLAVVLIYNRHFKDNLDTTDNLDYKGNIMVNIPLLQKAINIDVKESIANNKTAYINGGFVLTNGVYFVSGIFFLLFALYCLSNLIRMLLFSVAKLSEYDKQLRNILKEYDRLIVTTVNVPKISEYEVFDINNFTELVDLRDNLKTPIMFTEITKHVKAYFYIIDGSKLYLYKLKDVDISK